MWLNVACDRLASCQVGFYEQLQPGAEALSVSAQHNNAVASPLGFVQRDVQLGLWLQSHLWGEEGDCRGVGGQLDVVELDAISIDASATPYLRVQSANPSAMSIHLVVPELVAC